MSLNLRHMKYIFNNNFIMFLFSISILTSIILLRETYLGPIALCGTHLKSVGPTLVCFHLVMVVVSLTTPDIYSCFSHLITKTC